MFNKNYKDEIIRINLRPLRTSREPVSPFKLGSLPNASEATISMNPISRYSNNSLIDLRRRSADSFSQFKSLGEEDAKRFSDSRRQTALDALCYDNASSPNDSIVRSSIQRLGSLKEEQEGGYPDGRGSSESKPRTSWSSGHSWGSKEKKQSLFFKLF